MMERLSSLLRKSGEWIAPIAAVSMVFVMLVPLPSFMLDLLLTLSITASILVLLTAIQILRPVQFSVFPSLLLLLTLLRLSLDLAGTRRILLHGNEGTGAAGKVIESFGQFVVGGNYIVGFVLFLALIAIQFLVISHGAVRTAEVTARFTLDAMPGKQMAIDADLNAGLINEQQANLNQQAAGQAATQAAQQQLGSENLLGNVLANQQSGNLGLLTGAGGLQNQQNSNAISNNQGTNQINQATAAQNAGFQQQANQSAFGAASGLLGGLANAAGGFAGLGGFGGGGGGGVTNAMSAGMDPDQYSNGGLVHPALMAAMKAKGGRVPGKAQTAGNSPRNDTVPALLSPGEIVVPRTVAHDPVAAKEFVRAIIEHRKGKGQAAGSKR